MPPAAFPEEIPRANRGLQARRDGAQDAGEQDDPILYLEQLLDEERARDQGRRRFSILAAT